jgi:hypothetical protein
MVESSENYEAARLEAMTGVPTLVSDVIANGSEYEAAGRRIGNLGLQVPNRHGQPAAARFQGGAYVSVDNIQPFVFKPTESLTLQAWFQTGSRENQVIAARQGGYSIGLKNGRLSAWLMQDGGQFVEAVGTAPAADGQWHHAAAVYDRQAQTLAVFLDGKPDGAPQSIAAIGASTTASPLTLGSFGSGFSFDGSLDEISIQRAALAPGAFSFTADYPAAPPVKPGAQTGRYTAAPCDWGQPARLLRLRATATLNGGTIQARIETSDDDFKTIAATRTMALEDGDHTVSLAEFPPNRAARLAFTLSSAPASALSPVLGAVELAAQPVNP